MTDQPTLLEKIMSALADILPQEAPSISQEATNEASNSGFLLNKSLNEELRQATFIALEPETIDLHGDVYSVAEVRKACHNFNTFCEKAYIDHAVETEEAKIVESYIAPADLEINGEAVKKGTWLAVFQFNDELWQEVKKGTYNGISIAAYATTEEDVDG